MAWWNPLDWFKPQKEQLCLVMCEDLNDEKVAIALKKGYMETNKTEEAWYLVPRWLVEMANGERLQIITERNCIPIPLGLIYGIDSEDDVKKLTDLKPIAREKYKEEKADAEKRANRNKWLMNGMVIIACSIGAMIVFFAMVSLYQSGKLHIPGVS